MMFPSLQSFPSSSMLSKLTVVFVLLALFYIFLSRSKADKKRLPLPPAPPGYPLIGNVVDMAKAGSQAHLQLFKWAQEYGEVFRIEVGPITEYFLNSDAIVKELFDRSSSATAERPRWIVSNEMICNQLNVLLLNGSDPRWKSQRRAIHAGMTSVPKADAGLPFLHYETAKFLHEIAQQPSHMLSSRRAFQSIGRYTYSTFASQTFGMQVSDSDNPVIEYIFDTGTIQILGTLPGAHLVDIIPALSYLPGFCKPWERKAKARFQRDLTWSRRKLARVKARLADGEHSDAFLSSALMDEKSLGLSGGEDEAAYLSLMLIIGAADTSKMSTWSFLEAMLSFPDVQQKLYEEITRAVGDDRLPVFEDLERIPYVRSTMKELWRWRPPVALGHPHTTTKELVYNGYRIPKGARLHLNAYAIGHDPRRHADPERFWPERFADDTNSTMQSINAKDVKDRDHFAFGSGRRVCPGYHVAERSLAVAIMRLVWACHIELVDGWSLPLNPSQFAGDMPGNPGENLPVTLRIRKSRLAIVEREFKKIDRERMQLEELDMS